MTGAESGGPHEVVGPRTGAQLAPPAVIRCAASRIGSAGEARASGARSSSRTGTRGARGAGVAQRAGAPTTSATG
ncbi:hypothetical protein [Pseudonocardia adelaidensis]|uniref:hypothetical protein n=1 Tax=Pseudonocardia adelaidensis TaxID=648754 RepID=UPI0031EF86F9